MTIVGVKRDSPIIESFVKYGDAGLFSKTVKRVIPATINNLDEHQEQDQDYSVIATPLLVKQELDLSLEHDIDSPLVAVTHHLELTFNFGGEVDEIRAKIPVIVSSVPDSISIHSSNSGGNNRLKKHAIETQLHHLPLSVELADAIPNTKRHDGYRSALDNSSTTSSPLKDSFWLSTADGKTLKKAASDQNISRTRTSSEKSLFRGSSSGKRRSITPSPPTSRPSSTKSNKLPVKSIDIHLANNKAAHYMYTPTSATFASSSTPFDDEDRAIAALKSPFGGAFMGLHPPPRKNNRKKEPAKTTPDSDDSSMLSRQLTTSSSTSTASAKTLSRPTSPASIAQTSTSNAMDHYTMPLPPVPHHHSNSHGPPPESGHLLSPTTTARRAWLNQSKSSNTSSSSKTSSIKKRSNSIDPESIYSTSITNHYVEAQLPPIPSSSAHHPTTTNMIPSSPPVMARQRLPSVPNVEEHRKTRLYFEEEDSDDDDISFYFS